MPDTLNGAPDIRSREVEDLCCSWSEAANDEIARQQQNGRVNADLHIIEIGVSPVQLTVPADHFIVDGGQLFVRGLQFLLGGFQLLIDTL